MATNDEYVKQAYNNIMANKATAIAVKQAEILEKEVTPEIEEKKRKFQEVFAAAQKKLDTEIQALIDAGKARGEAEVNSDYKKYDLLKSLMGEE